MTSTTFRHTGCETIDKLLTRVENASMRNNNSSWWKRKESGYDDLSSEEIISKQAATAAKTIHFLQKQLLELEHELEQKLGKPVDKTITHLESASNVYERYQRLIQYRNYTDELGSGIAKIAALEKDSRFLSCLRSAGVDDWEGYEQALELMNEEGD